MQKFTAVRSEGWHSVAQKDQAGDGGAYDVVEKPARANNLADIVGRKRGMFRDHLLTDEQVDQAQNHGSAIVPGGRDAQPSAYDELPERAEDQPDRGEYVTERPVMVIAQLLL